MLYANANHAICDGRCLIQFLTFATALQEGCRAWQLGLPDWKDLVAQVESPERFLASKNQILTIKELCQEHTSKGDSFRFDITHDSLLCLRQRLKSDATLTGLLIAVFMQCLAAEYRGSEARDLGVSVLVDLRGIAGTTSPTVWSWLNPTVTSPVNIPNENRIHPRCHQFLG